MVEVEALTLLTVAGAAAAASGCTNFNGFSL